MFKNLFEKILIMFSAMNFLAGAFVMDTLPALTNTIHALMFIGTFSLLMGLVIVMMKYLGNVY